MPQEKSSGGEGSIVFEVLPPLPGGRNYSWYVVVGGGGGGGSPWGSSDGGGGGVITSPGRNEARRTMGRGLIRGTTSGWWRGNGPPERQVRRSAIAHGAPSSEFARDPVVVAVVLNGRIGPTKSVGGGENDQWGGVHVRSRSVPPKSPRFSPRSLVGKGERWNEW